MPKSAYTVKSAYLPVENAHLAKVLLQLGTDIAQRKLVADGASGGGLTLSVDQDLDTVWIDSYPCTEIVGKTVTLNSDMKFVPAREDPPSPAELLKILPTKEVLQALMDELGVMVIQCRYHRVRLVKTKNKPRNIGMPVNQALANLIVDIING